MHADILSLAEHEATPVHAEIMKRLRHLGAPGLTVLDWGSGRGSDVLHLRNMGLQAYGVEVDRATIERGRALFERFGIDHDSTVKEVQPGNRIDFKDDFFDMIFSQQVLEHVRDLDSLARETFRVTRSGGMAVHNYPAHHHLIEAHLCMPLVHWLPKNRWRYGAIRLMVTLGIEPSHWHMPGLGARQRAEAYHRFSVEETFYRTPREVIATFERAGFRARFESHRHIRIQRLGLDKLLPERLLGSLLTHFKSCVLVLQKPSQTAISSSDPRRYTLARNTARFARNWLFETSWPTTSSTSAGPGCGAMPTVTDTPPPA